MLLLFLIILIAYHNGSSCCKSKDFDIVFTEVLRMALSTNYFWLDRALFQVFLFAIALVMDYHLALWYVLAFLGRSFFPIFMFARVYVEIKCFWNLWWETGWMLSSWVKYVYLDTYEMWYIIMSGLESWLMNLFFSLGKRVIFFKNN